MSAEQATDINARKKTYAIGTKIHSRGGKDVPLSTPCSLVCVACVVCVVCIVCIIRDEHVVLCYCGRNLRNVHHTLCVSVFHTSDQKSTKGRFEKRKLSTAGRSGGHMQ